MYICILCIKALFFPIQSTNFCQTGCPQIVKYSSFFLTFRSFQKIYPQERVNGHPVCRYNTGDYVYSLEMKVTLLTPNILIREQPELCNRQQGSRKYFTTRMNLSLSLSPSISFVKVCIVYPEDFKSLDMNRKDRI